MKGTDLNLSFGLNEIYNNASFQFQDKDKVGIVGVNGAGKTTLFKILLKEIELDSGKIEIVNKRIGYLPQEIKDLNEDITVMDYILNARPIKKLEEKLTKYYEKVAVTTGKEQDKIMKKISSTQELLEYYHYYSAENEMLDMVSNLEIDFDLLDLKLTDLSGGQKSKIAFAALLYSMPEILLLDEPTNHLDVETRQFITNYLKNYKGMVLIISHDTEFLDQITNKILYIDKVSKKMKTYIGNYKEFKRKQKQEKEAKEKLIEKQEKEIKELQAFIDKAKKASRTNHNLKRMGKDREIKLAKKLEELEHRDNIYKKVKLNIKPLRDGSKIPLKINNISFSYGEKNIIKNLSFNITNKERFLIVGENGVGKSTLLKLIVGILKPNEGTIWYGSKTDIAYYAQELEILDQEKTIIENVDNGKYNDKELRTSLSNFLFFGDEVFKKVKDLSPGEKARVGLCKIMLMQANFIILDEPTNHLDPETQKIIGENFKKYEGTLIIVSHNPSFVSTIGINRMLILPQGKITNFNEELLNYYYQLNTNSRNTK